MHSLCVCVYHRSGNIRPAISTPLSKAFNSLVSQRRVIYMLSFPNMQLHHHPNGSTCEAVYWKPTHTDNICTSNRLTCRWTHLSGDTIDFLFIPSLRTHGSSCPYIACVPVWADSVLLRYQFLLRHAHVTRVLAANRHTSQHFAQHLCLALPLSTEPPNHL